MVRAPVYLLGDLKYISVLCTLFNGKRFIPVLYISVLCTLFNGKRFIPVLSPTTTS